MRRFLLNNIELCLSFLGLVVIFLMSYALHSTMDVWHTAAITSILVGALHGVLFWVIRRRQRIVRQRAIEDIREMLQDVVLNPLAAISVGTYLIEKKHPNITVNERYLCRIRCAVEEISLAMNTISDESLGMWKHRYRNMADIQEMQQERLT